LTYPTEETIEVARGSSTYIELSNFPLKSTTADIPFLYSTTAGQFVGTGKDANSRLVTAASGINANITFDADTDDMFVASWNGSAESESYLIRATNFITESSVDKADFQYLKDGAWTTFKTKATNQTDGDSFSLGSVDLRVHWINNSQNNLSVMATTANVNFNQLFSKEGLRVQLPYSTTNDTGINDNKTEGSIIFTVFANGTASGALGHNASSFWLVAKEEDKDDNVGAGDFINITAGWDSGSTPEPQVNAVYKTNVTTETRAVSTEIVDTDVFRDFTYSALATEILFDQPSSGQKSVKLMYHGSEVTADAYITAPEAVLSGGASLGDVLVTDSEVSSVKSKNLIVVGGSCINSAAASLVGGAYCGSAWTSATGVGAGQFLIKGYASSSVTTKMALLVAGYEAGDTTNAATYLRTQNVDTSKSYKGTSGTQASLVVA
jgi:hypothetical protein